MAAASQASNSRGAKRGAGPITRDLTAEYGRHLRERKVNLHAAGGRGYGQVPSSDPLLEGGGGVPEPRFNRRELPPKLVDSAEEAHENFKVIQRKLVDLKKAQQRRLLKVFQSDETGDPDVDAIAQEISIRLHQCEKLVLEVKAQGRQQPNSGTAAAMAFQDNVQRSLAQEFQQVSREVRECQRAYLQELQRRAGGGGATSSSAGSPDIESGKEPPQLTVMEMEELERLTASRSNEICQVASTISDLHAMMKDLAAIVIDQGTVLDRIDYNMERVFMKGEEATAQLQKAEQHKKKATSRAHRALLVLLFLNFISLFIYTIKLKMKYGWTLTFLWLGFLASVLLGLYGLVAWKCPSYRPGMSATSASMVWQDCSECKLGLGSRLTALRLFAAAKFGGGMGLR